MKKIITIGVIFLLILTISCSGPAKDNDTKDYDSGDSSGDNSDLIEGNPSALKDKIVEKNSAITALQQEIDIGIESAGARVTMNIVGPYDRANKEAAANISAKMRDGDMFTPSESMSGELILIGGYINTKGMGGKSDEWVPEEADEFNIGPMKDQMGAIIEMIRMSAPETLEDNTIEGDYLVIEFQPDQDTADQYLERSNFDEFLEFTEGSSFIIKIDKDTLFIRNFEASIVMPEGFEDGQVSLTMEFSNINEQVIIKQPNAEIE